jgi:hypothetical protein
MPPGFAFAGGRARGAASPRVDARPRRAAARIGAPLGAITFRLALRAISGFTTI